MVINFVSVNNIIVYDYILAAEILSFFLMPPTPSLLSSHFHCMYMSQIYTPPAASFIHVYFAMDDAPFEPKEQHFVHLLLVLQVALMSSIQLSCSIIIII